MRLADVYFIIRNDYCNIDKNEKNASLKRFRQNNDRLYLAFCTFKHEDQFIINGKSQNVKSCLYKGINI